jgi:predicted histidine transporter YuiF (NhaC family)
MTANGMPVTIADVTRYNWMIGAAMLAGLLIAVFFSYRKPRTYENKAVDTSETDAVSDKITREHLVTIVAIIVVVVVQILSESLALSALCGVLVMILGGAIAWKNIDEQFSSGIRLMGMIAMIMLVAGGYAEVMKATNAVDALVEAAVVIMGGSKWIAACVITLIGLLVTMGIGSSFSTVPVLAVLYVPLCQRMGFSPAATILLMSAAAALGDAGSPASDTTLGPTSGLNADGQHDHIWDTCVPTFLHFNIPIMLVSIVMSQFI